MFKFQIVEHDSILGMRCVMGTMCCCMIGNEQKRKKNYINFFFVF